MRRFFKVSAALALGMGLFLGGCSPKSAQLEPAKVYTIYKHKVTFTPPAGWKERSEKSPDAKDQVAAIIFEPPTGYGHIAVTVTDGITQTQEFMNTLYNGIRARQGKIIKQDYEHKLDDPDQKNAYWMEFELKDAGPGHPVQKGRQVQIFGTQQKVLYSLVFTADPEVYDANRETFLAMVKSFELAK
jgi:hypothetical protein